MTAAPAVFAETSLEASDITIMTFQSGICIIEISLQKTLPLYKVESFSKAILQFTILAGM